MAEKVTRKSALRIDIEWMKPCGHKPTGFEVTRMEITFILDSLFTSDTLVPVPFFYKEG